MIDYEKHFTEIENIGFTTIKQIISPVEIAELKHSMEIAINEDNKKHEGKPNKIHDYVVDLPNYGMVFVNFLNNEIMNNVFSHFLGDTWTTHSYVSAILRPSKTDFYSQKMHVDEPRIIPNYHLGLLMALALDDFTEENGSTWNLPRSFNMKDLPSEDYFNENAVQSVRKAGDALFWRPRVAHRAGINRTDKTRNMISFHATRSFVKQRLDYPRIMKPELISQASDRAKRILGFNVRSPSSMDEYYVPTQQRMYQPNQG